MSKRTRFNVCFFVFLLLFVLFLFCFVYSEHLQLYIYIWCELLTDSQYDWNTAGMP